MSDELAALQRRRDVLVGRLEEGDAKCWQHDPRYGNGPEAWTRMWLGLLEQYEEVERQIRSRALAV